MVKHIVACNGNGGEVVFGLLEHRETLESMKSVLMGASAAQGW